MMDKEAQDQAEEMIRYCKKAKEAGVVLMLTYMTSDSIPNMFACSSEDPAVIGQLIAAEVQYQTESDDGEE